MNSRWLKVGSGPEAQAVRKCVYCMPEEGVPLTSSEKLLTSDEIVQLASLFVTFGVNKIRLTGGEPLVRKDAVNIIESLAKIPQLTVLGITTNGLVLSKKISDLRKAGLTHVNISLDTLVPEKFEFLARRKGWHVVRKSIDDALATGFDSVKVNCVVMKGINEDELVNFVKLTESNNLEVRFIEYMPFDGNKWSRQKLVPFERMLAVIKQEWPMLERHEDGPNHTSKHYESIGENVRTCHEETVKEMTAEVQDVDQLSSDECDDNIASAVVPPDRSAKEAV
ncbi:hypothetical protein HPB51_013303 [Rhipicephalus microplus]|uniref:Radical SAM core domain-containing protein n=1 Tax=Rhipicephalus microplus TaxID=6941 RepID=A0A9J6DGU5_RHIMP|nr:hypothetical protein HPB51_013303 [Rhipicephalus microplus]